jgi:hypothetical protein
MRIEVAMLSTSPNVILLAKSEIRTIDVQHELESRVCRRTNSCETDFASSISFGEAEGSEPPVGA